MLTINSLTAIASAPVSGSTTARTFAGNGTAFGVDANYNSEAYTGGGAKFGSLGPHVGAVFNAASTFVFGSGAEATLANTSTTSTTYINSIEWNVNTSALPSGVGHNLDVGLVSESTRGTGFTSLTFSVEEDATAVLTETFTSVSAADTYFSDDLVNLGQWTSGSTLVVLASLSVTAAGSGNGYGIAYLVGVDPVPEPATWSVFGLGLLGLGWSKSRWRRQRPMG
jgi:hypothetical protein